MDIMDLINKYDKLTQMDINGHKWTQQLVKPPHSQNQNINISIINVILNRQVSNDMQRTQDWSLIVNNK
ncbi:hypothetical protein pb186bvf_007359 [Paramecium bursaria]